MSTPVTTDRWAGNFDCTTCERKRLEGKEFSTKAMENWRSKQKPLRCKQCVDKAAKDERDLSAAKAKAKAKAEEATTAPIAATSGTSGSVSSAGVSSSSSAEPETALCSTCKKELLVTQFNNTQLRKGDQKRCRGCVEEAESSNRKDVDESKSKKLQEARERLAKAEAGGTAAEHLQASMWLSALEAEAVTGLKAISLKGSIRGRGRGR